MVDLVGLIIKNTSGIIQIDQNHPVLQLRAKGSVTLTPYTSSGDTSSLYTATITYTADDFPSIAIKPTGGWASIVSESRSGNTITWMVAGLGAYTVSYYIFDRPVAGPNNCDLRIKDPSTGKILFSMASPPMRLVDTYDWDGSADIAYAIPSGKSYAIQMYGEVQVRIVDHEDTSVNPPVHNISWTGWLNNAAYVHDGAIHTTGAYEEYWGANNGPGPGDNWGFIAANAGVQNLMIVDVTIADGFSF